MTNQYLNTEKNQDNMDEDSILSPVEQRIEILQDSTSTSEKFKVIAPYYMNNLSLLRI